MSIVIDFLGAPSFSFWNQALTVADVLGFATGLWCVWLTARKRILNLPVGIANGALLLLLFALARLFADASLQIVFIILGVRGWWLWARHGAADPAPITTRGDSLIRWGDAA